MAKIGLKYVVGALLDESGADPAYTNGIVVGKAISSNISIETSDSKLYADDQISESIKDFSSGNITLGIDDLGYDVQGLLLGHAVTGGELIANSNDLAPYVGIGFYSRVVRSGVKKYRAIWLYKTIFGEPTDEFATKGESIEFKTPSIEGTIMPLGNGDWKIETLVDTEAAAVSWLNDMAGIVEV